MKIIWDRKKITDGEVSLYNAPLNLMKCKSLHLAQTLQYEQAVECMRFSAREHRLICHSIVW